MSSGFVLGGPTIGGKRRVCLASSYEDGSSICQELAAAKKQTAESFTHDVLAKQNCRPVASARPYGPKT
jgi:hypothetical protein